MAKHRQSEKQPAGHRTAEYWRACADKARTAAEQADSDARASMLAVAKSYDVLAAHSDPDTKLPLLEQLARAAQQGAEEGERHIRKQRDIISRLKRDGHDTYEAERLLRTFEETQVLHTEHADHLTRAAAEHKPRGSSAN